MDGSVGGGVGGGIVGGIGCIGVVARVGGSNFKVI